MSQPAPNMPKKAAHFPSRGRAWRRTGSFGPGSWSNRIPLYTSKARLRSRIHEDEETSSEPNKLMPHACNRGKQFVDGFKKSAPPSYAAPTIS